MKIDVHVHITPPDIIKDWEKYAANEPYFKMLSESPVNKFATAEQAVEALEADGFDMGVAFGFGFQDMGLCRYVNDYVIEKVREFPDRLVGFAVVVPQHREMERELIRCYENGLRGVGEIFPEGQEFALASAEEMSPFASLCTELDIPVLLHLNEPVGHYYAGKTKTTLWEAEQFARNFPELDIIYAHWGGGLFFYELMREVSRTLKNVYYDTAASIFLYGHKVYNVVKTLGFTDKILFGSDYPLLPLNRYFRDLGRSELTEDEKAAILGGNALRLLRIETPC
ncbi:MAG: amidohydrolase family protein [Saccharofermentanales bacterium]|jgi:predicted TIM-barrel fold metal-dependent hydrolase